MRNKSKEKRIVRDLVVGFTVSFSSYILWRFKRMTPHERKKKIKSIENGVHRGFNTVVDFFVPHERNGFKPHIFHHRSVHTLLLITLLLKITIVSLLFAIYPNEAFFASNVKDEMYGLINQYRISRNGGPLTTSTYLEQVAQKKANDMVANNYFSHFGLDGKKPWQWIDKSVYNYSAMGENLAMDFLTANAVLHAFQQSPTHDKNLLLSAYSEIGIAVVSGTIEGHTTNLMVVYFGHPKTTQLVQVVKAAEIVSQPSPQPTPQPVTTQPSTTKPKAAAPVTNTNLNLSKNTNQVAPKTQPTQPIPPAPVQPLNTNQTITVTPPVEPEVAASEQPIEGKLAVRPGGDATEILGVAINTDPTSKEPSLYFGPLDDSREVSARGDIVQTLNAWSGRFFGVLLIALLFIFLINIFTKIHIQHAPIIANALLLIIVELALFAFNFHKVEAISENIRILGQWFM